MIRKSFVLALAVSVIASTASAQVVRDMTVSKVGSTGFGDFHYYGQSSGIRTYSFGTTSCNEGNIALQWTAMRVNIPQNFFRVMDGRVEQLGYSWLKLGFCAVNENSCGSCQGTSCATLGVGCADTYGSGLNDGAGGHGKADVNPVTGVHVQGQTSPSGSLPLRGRLQVQASEMGLAGATYFAESQYICEDDAKAGHARNNASWRQLNTTSGSGAVNGQGHIIHRHECAVEAWATLDSTVTVVDVDNTAEPAGAGFPMAVGHFVLGYKVTNIGGGQHRYEYALQNLTSDQSGASFSIPLNCGGLNITDIFFRDVNHHSGSPYSNTDWTATVDGSSITWEVTQTFAQNANANALRWGTLFNFGFTADSGPSMTNAAIGLFKPGPVSALNAAVEGPCGGAVCGVNTYCVSTPNSFGILVGANIGSSGSTSIGANDLVLEVDTAPPGQFGLFYYGAIQAQTPFGNGFRCIDGEVFRLNPPTNADNLGLNSNALDYSQAPMNAGNGAITAGSTWNFQYWFRDPMGGGALFNLSDALEVTFCP